MQPAQLGPAARASYGLAILYDNQQKYLTAIKMYKQALVYAQEARGWPELERQCYNGLACALLSRKKKSGQSMFDSIEWSKRHLDLCDDMANRFIAFTNMGLAHFALGDYDAALECHGMALGHVVHIKNNYAERAVISNIAGAAIRLYDFERTMACLRRYEALSRRMGDKLGQATGLKHIGILSNRMKQVKESRIRTFVRPGTETDSRVVKGLLEQSIAETTKADTKDFRKAGLIGQRTRMNYGIMFGDKQMKLKMNELKKCFEA